MIALSVAAVVSYALHDPARFFLLDLWPTHTRKVSPPVKAVTRNREKAVALGTQSRNENQSTSGVWGSGLLTKRERGGAEGSPGLAAAVSGPGVSQRAVGPEAGFFSPDVLCFTHQLAVMVCVATLIMHVQVRQIVECLVFSLLSR